MSKKVKIILATFILLFLLVFVVKPIFFGNKNTKLESTKVKRQDIEEKLTVSGKVVADEDAQISFQTAGLLSWVGVKEGDTVKKYQAIASLDQRTVRSNLNKYLNTYTKERLSFDQSKIDNKNKQDSGDDVIRSSIATIYQQNQLDLNNSVIDVQLQNLALQLSTISTPIAGLVVRVDNPYAGVTISPTSVFEVVNPQSVYFEATVDQNEVTQLSEGMQGNLSLDSFPDENLFGSIQKIGFTPKADETNTVYPIKFYFTTDNSGYKYRIGMTGDLTFITNKKIDVLTVPPKYVKFEKGKKYVLTGTKDKQIKTTVETGLETDDAIEITSGLTEGTTIYDQTN